MPRPIRCRKVYKLPKNNKFGPVNCKMEKETITMTVDEYETIRLIDLEGFTQEECAKQMSVARTTIQGIYNKARQKIADVLVNGKILVIEGGEYEICKELKPHCKKRCNGQGCCKKNKEELKEDN